MEAMLRWLKESRSLHDNQLERKGRRKSEMQKGEDRERFSDL